MARIRTRLQQSHQEATFVNEAGDTMTGVLNFVAGQFGSPSAVAAAGDAGTGVASLARANHVHPHGTGYSPDAHHAQAHVGNGADHTYSGLTTGHVLRATSPTAAAFGSMPHSDLGSIGANDHHPQGHVLSGADHSASGLTTGHVLRASGATTFAWAQLAHADLGTIGANDHHAQLHAAAHQAGGGDALDAYFARLGADNTLADGVDFAVGSTTGTKIGTATTQKLGFWNATPIVQPTAYTQTFASASKTHATRLTTGALTNSIGLAQNLTIEDMPGLQTAPTGMVTGERTAIRNNFSDLAEYCNDLRADLDNTAQVLNALIDDLQAMGLVG